MELSEGRSLTLDAIRALAAQAVLWGHAFVLFKTGFGEGPPSQPYIQDVAVVIFFVLSGFVIARSLDLGTNFRDFAINRFSRIYSGLVPCLFIILIIDCAVKAFRLPYAFGTPLNPIQFIGNILMLQDHPLIPQITSYVSARPLWTVAVEWWIYLFAGLVVFNWRKINAPLALLLAVLAIVPIYNLIGGRGNGLFLYWLGGAGGYLILAYGPKIDPRLAAIAALAVMACAIARLGLNKWDAYEPAFGMMVALSLLFCIAAVRDVSIPFPKIIRAAAAVSFTLYLLHCTILEAMISAQVGGFWTGIIVCNIVALIVGRYTEMRHKELAALLRQLIARHLPSADTNLLLRTDMGAAKAGKVKD